MPDFDEYDDDSAFGYEEDYDDDYLPMGGGPRLFDMIMERALQDPDFAHIHQHVDEPSEPSDHPWETDDADSID